uniref:Hydrogenase maturation factor HypA n=1 Tax=Ignavibacterium album TaxID=591197 RepID=A0A832G2R3_9BACT
MIDFLIIFNCLEKKSSQFRGQSLFISELFVHELSIAQNIIQIVNSSVEEDKLGLVEMIALKIGLMSNVLTDSLQFSYASIAENTPLKNSRLDIELLPIKIRCNDCNEINTTNDFIFSCPNCKSPAINVIGGDEIIISSIHLKDESG